MKRREMLFKSRGGGGGHGRFRHGHWGPRARKAIPGCSTLPERGLRTLAWSIAAGTNSPTPRRFSSALGRKHGFDVVCSQDPKIFEGDLDQYDAIAFYTTGKAISAEGKANLLEAIHGGKGFVGIHSATDTFRIPDSATRSIPIRP